EVEEVIEREVLARDLMRGGDGRLARGGIGVEGAQLVRVLPVPQVRPLLDDQRQPAREERPSLLVEVAGNLCVVRRGQRERLSSELLSSLGADGAHGLDV